MPKVPPAADDSETPETPQKNPKLQYRLPREDNCLSVPFDDPPPLLDQAQALLGPRMKITRHSFFLDGKICNLKDIMKAARLKYKDE